MKKQICLAIEATARHLGLSLHSFSAAGNVQPLASFFKELPVQQSGLLVPTLDKLIRKARLKPADISLIAVDVGPGSFTGVRVGLAAARALAQTLSVPLVGVTSLEALAYEASSPSPRQFFSRGPGSSLRTPGPRPINMPGRRLMVPWIQALAGEVYFAAYQELSVVRAPAWVPEKELGNFLSHNKAAMKITGTPRAESLAVIGIRRFLKSPRSPKFHHENALPLYLQPSWAERNRDAKRA